ncbi:MAG: putative ABC transporter permease subunit [Thermomicrobiales bacterium]
MADLMPQAVARPRIRTPQTAIRNYFADLWLLLGLRWQVAWNTFKGRKPIAKIGVVIGGLWIAFFLASAAASIGYGAGRLLQHFPDLRLEPLLPGALLTVVAAIVLISSFGVALGSLLLANDLETLMTAPVSRRAVFTAKILDGLGVYYGLVLITAVPALLTYGLGLGYGPLYYVLAVIAILGTPLLPAGIGALLVLLVARFAPARRVREVLGLAGALIGISCSLLVQTARIWTRQLNTVNGDLHALADLLRRLELVPLPSFVAGRGLAAAGTGHWLTAAGELAGFLVLTFGTFAACLLLADRLYATGWARMQGGGTARRSQAQAQRDAARSGWLGRAPAWAAIALKDWRTIPRDLRSFAQLISPLVFLPLIYLNLLGGRQNGLAAVLRDNQRFSIAAGTLLATVLVFRRVAAIGISMEGQAWWILKSAPVSGMEVLRGKFAAAAIPFALLSTLLLVVAAIWRGFGLAGTLYGWFGIELLGLGMLAIATGASVPWARLDWDDPRRMSSGWGGLLSFTGAALLTGIAGGLLCLPVLAATFTPNLVPVAWAVGPVLAVVITLAVGWSAIRLGAAALGRVGEA